MRFRGKSIRRKIVALLLVPLVALTVLWGLATTLAGSQAKQLIDVRHVIKTVGNPVEESVGVLQSERRQTLIFLADPTAADSLTELRARRGDTDRALATVRKAESAARDRMDDISTERLDRLVGSLEGLGLMRRSVDESTVTREKALAFYNGLVDPSHNFLASLYGHEDVDGDNWGRALIGFDRAREMLSREDALVASALIARRVTPEDVRATSDLVANRTLLYDTNLADLPLSDRATLEQYWRTPATLALREAENRLIAAGATETPKTLDAAGWQQMTASVLEDLTRESDEATELYRGHIDPVRNDIFVRVGFAAALGLVALLVSIIVSVRVGRDLIRDLSRLRKEAHEVSGVRLPSVMRRLAAGEPVDVETEAPRLDYERDEVGQVGQALNTLQRAAVEAAVKQADLRRGVSEVFVNLARRNQVLLHRQLTLLDTMERRTEDTEELADLFRLDHLTTRMRRHAEGLVILSGAAPSRQWRKPVQLMDVVRAAVAEVEDYERIEVRRLPRIGVGGPAVADLTHLIAELLENATVFSPPHTAVQVHGERVANGFTLEIHDRGLGMAPEVLLDANLRLAETPEFELSDTDRLGLFVVSRLAQRQNVRVSLQPSPYGGTTAIVFLPVALLTDAPETEGTGFRLDRKTTTERGRHRADGGGGGRRTALAQVPAGLGSEPSVLDGPVELEPPVRALERESGPLLGGGDGITDIEDTESERGGLFRAREHLRDSGLDVPYAGDDGRDPYGGRDTGDAADGLLSRDDVRGSRDDARDFRDRRDGRPVQPPRGRHGQPQRPVDATASDRPAGLPRRKPPTLVVDRGRRVDEVGRAATEPERAAGGTGRTWSGVPAQPSRSSAPGGPASDAAPPMIDGLPRRIRQASLAPQLKDTAPDRGTDLTPATGQDTERDADEVRSRMASLQRGWQRGRRQNDAEDPTGPGEIQGTTSEGDGR
ncbi:nitrate- and nitrite sensing domain-containing protein [Streptomyces scopuliridis]|uniref:histidine kinase n=1 Tax=Streptomyces scopuliridis RB72 TaxID=1440053 RepID=A0A2T7TBT7_9ACTN|nr:nitrate- and nitrite sensing domain-containing protein [Streptomyces scopuliridis]PVE12552.1 histidine kinase [Streptomyces scopuliridis RB72]